MQHFPNDRVMIAADMNSPASDLTFKGGIDVILDPTDADIEDAVNQDFEWGVWDQGQLEQSRDF